MQDSECVQLLQWALPRLHMRWSGFRKVRRQVCKRIDRRLRELGLADVSAYRGYLAAHPTEWSALDALCWISISRFYRDKGVFQYLEREVLPEAARLAAAGGGPAVRCWSIGCASGEEPYTLAMLWGLGVAPRFPTLGIRVLATDVDPRAVERAHQARYAASSLKDLPEGWLLQACLPSAGGFIVKPGFREVVAFLQQDIREATPEDTFHCVLCRNVAFTYFDDGLQREALLRIKGRLLPGGGLVIGRRESLPEGVSGFEPWAPQLGVYRRAGDRSP